MVVLDPIKRSALDTYNLHISHTHTTDDDILLDANKWPPQADVIFSENVFNLLLSW